MDIGASTGGFTDCMLQNGASKYLVDVGYGQLDWKEEMTQGCRYGRTNIRYVTYDDIVKIIHSIDVSLPH